MDWLNVTFIIFITLGLLLFVYGIKNKSVLSLFFGGTLFIVPIFYFINLKAFLPFVPPIAMAIAYIINKRIKPA